MRSCAEAAEPDFTTAGETPAGSKTSCLCYAVPVWIQSKLSEQAAQEIDRSLRRGIEFDLVDLEISSGARPPRCKPVRQMKSKRHQ